MDNQRVYRMSFAGVYPHYINKAEKKGRAKAEVDEIIKTTRIDNLSFIPAGILPGDSVGILNSQRMTDLIAKVKSQYDLVFFDSPPILGVSDGSVLTSEMDMTVMVVQHRRFPRAMLQRSITRLPEGAPGAMSGVHATSLPSPRSWNHVPVNISFATIG